MGGKTVKVPDKAGTQTDDGEYVAARTFRGAGVIARKNSPTFNDGLTGALQAERDAGVVLSPGDRDAMAADEGASRARRRRDADVFAERLGNAKKDRYPKDPD